MDTEEWEPSSQAGRIHKTICGDRIIALHLCFVCLPKQYMHSMCLYGSKF